MISEQISVLMIARDTLYTSPGGDTIQVVSTAKYLRKLGVNVDIKLSSEDINYIQYNIIHFFNIIRPDDILPHLSKSNLPFVISTIFVDYSEYERENRVGLLGAVSKIFDSDRIEYLKTLARFLKNGDKIKSLSYLINGQRASIIKIAKKSALLLPNSHSEYNRFEIRYKTNSNYLKVHNAIDVEKFNDQVTENKLYLNHVISVGRIEGRKNQLNLIKALIGSDVNLTLIGKPSPNHMAYFEECKKLVDENNNMRILEHIDQAELAGIYKAAKVHVLPSWFETTGLSSLEAAAMDCNVVITKKGDTEEYFKNFAYYCNVDDVESIRIAVLQAFYAPVNPLLKKMIIENYTWAVAAKETLEAYKSVF